MSKELQVGIVGLGGSGRFHIMGFKKHPNARVVAGVDLDPKRRQARIDEFGLKCYENMEEMFRTHKLDIVSIVVPPFMHKDLTIKAFEQGCHVLCEKPIGLNAGDCLSMVQAAKKAKRLLGIHLTHCFTPQVVAMKKLVDSGELGDIYFTHVSYYRRSGIPHFGSWGSKKALSGGGALSDIGIHQLAVGLMMMNFPEPAWVAASTYNHFGNARAEKEGKPFDVEDMGVALVKFKNGATLELEAAWAANVKDNDLITTRLLGVKSGMLQQKLNGNENPLALYSAKNGLPCDESIRTPSYDDPSHYEFVDSIINKSPYRVTGENGYAVMRILDAIYTSSETGAPVKIG
jgi:predicted dehydrogenase